MKLIPYSVHTGNENMQIDCDLLEDAINQSSESAVFRLYGWSPKCISIGRNQKSDFLTKINDIDVVRRVTGGRALLHDNEVTYSCVVPISKIPNGNNIKESYKHISSILINFFKNLGVTLDFGEDKKISTHFDYCMLLSTGADVCYKGKKIIGSAQYRKDGYILQHGSILFGYDKKLLKHLFNEEISGIITVNEILPDITKEIFIKKLENFIKKTDIL